ncbi:MAG TPA: HEPN domain-containing protein [Blastocatellia bacterium]|nr:HEPN domain-containing protein [Blastocatellia bacterium]
MKPITLEWIDKAEGDWDSAQREYRARKRPNYDATCFHAQQCVEKYLKARLEEAGIAFSKTHSLINLLTLVLAAEPNWTVLQPHLTALDIYSVVFRYPGNSATKNNARNAVKDCREARRVIRQSFGLPV